MSYWILLWNLRAVFADLVAFIHNECLIHIFRSTLLVFNYKSRFNRICMSDIEIVKRFSIKRVIFYVIIDFLLNIVKVWISLISRLCVLRLYRYSLPVDNPVLHVLCIDTWCSGDVNGGNAYNSFNIHIIFIFGSYIFVLNEFFE